MKKKLSLLLAIIVIFTMALPLQAFAETIDQSLEKAIKIAKSTFVIPDDYKFDSSISTDGTKKVFYLNWSNKNTADGSSISVSINEDGNILSFYSYSPSDYTQTKKLPTVSKQDALKKADEYIKLIDPELPAQIAAQTDNQSYGLDSSYYFNYYRVVNGLPFYNNSVSLSISKQTGKLQNFSRNWNFGLTFTKPDTAMAIEKAKQAYKDVMGLKLVYKYNYDYTKNAINIFPAYVPVYDNGSYVLDAVTGEKVHIQYYYGVAYDQSMSAMETKNLQSAAGAGTVVLTPDEQKAVAEAAKLKSLEQAEAIAKAAEFVGITGDYKLDSYSLYSDWQIKTNYTWNLSYSKTDSNGLVSSISVGINANTGVITSFYGYSSEQQGTKAVYKLKDAKAAADSLIEKYYADYKDQVKYDEKYTEEMLLNYDTTVDPTSYSIKYNRYVNGIEFPDNSILVEYNAITGKITSMNMTWFNIEFPSAAKAISLDAAYGKLFENIGLSMQYRLKTQSYKINGTGAYETPEVVLAYALNPQKPHILDAFTGAILDYTGSEYKETTLANYTDIEGSYAENQISVLAENGISLEGTEFKPAAAIVQKDFLLLLSKTLNYYGVVITKDSTQEEIDNFYAYLIREGVVKNDEKAPDAKVTREEAVKFIIRAMKYDKVADLGSIYKESTFTDRKQIAAGLESYVSIAAALNIVKGYKGAFNPKGELTRAAAAVMIYNYLQAK